MAKYTEADFHLPRPRPPTRDFRWYSLIVPPVGFSVGMVLFGLLGFSFVELRDMPALLRSNIVILGSIGLAIGSELGTLPALLEVFRKVGAGRAGIWDWIGLGVSVLTSITILIMSWAWLLQIDILWSETIRTYGPLVLGSFAILDFTASGIEAGLYLSTYDDRQRRWQTDLEDWLIEMNRRQEPNPPVEERSMKPTQHPDHEEMIDLQYPGPIGMIEHPVSLDDPSGTIISSEGPPVWTTTTGPEPVGLDIILDRAILSNKPCWCGWMQSNSDETPEAHAATHRAEARYYETASEALAEFKAHYDHTRRRNPMSLPDWPTVLEIVQWREEK